MHQTRLRVKIRAALMSAVLCVLSMLAIPVGAVPITFGVFAVLLTGVVLDARSAFISVLIYLLLGTLGLPVFAGAKSGLAVLIGPTGGYLWSYAPMCIIASRFAMRKTRPRAILGCMLALLLCYTLGTIQFMLLSGQTLFASLAICVYPFILFDCAKALLAVEIGLRISKIFRT